MNSQKKLGISRREFARRAAIASTVSLLPPASLPVATTATPPPPPSLTQDQPPLSAASRLEAEARFQAIVAAYPGRFNEQQQKELRHLSLSAQPALDRLRAYTVENGDSPALYLKPLVEREKKPETKPSGNSPSQPAKKP